MTLIPSLTRSSASASPMRTLRLSDSTTQGPAMRNGPPSDPKRWAMSVGQLRQRARALGARMELVMVERGADESREQRMGAHRPGLQFGMELTADIPGMLRQLDHLDERAVRRESRAAHAELRQYVAIGVGHLVAVAMTLADLGRIVRLRDPRARPEPARISAQSHRAAHLLNPFLRSHQRDDRILALRRELARVRVGDFADRAREFDDGRLQSQADPEEGELVLARPADRFQHALDPAHAEAPGDEQSV